MKAFDLERMSDRAPISTDVCIIGSGAAGMTIASELKDMRVIIVEGGGIDREAETEALYEVESIGDPRSIDQASIRARVLGGSTHIWSGRCAPFDPIDYQSRDWVRGSGWPIESWEIQRYFSRASNYLGLFPVTDELWPLIAPGKHAGADSADVEDRFWQASRDKYGRPVDFGRTLQPNAEILLHANVTRIDDHIVEARALNGNQVTINAEAIVLCAGGVENARLLLASGLGNDNVGRYYMDHIDCPIGVFDRRGAEEVFGHYWLDAGGRRNIYDYGLRLSAEVQRKERILNCHAFLLNIDDGTSAWSALRRLAQTRRLRPGLKEDIYQAGKNLSEVSSAIYRQTIMRRPFQAGRLEWHLMLEQAPYFESQIRLSKKRDALGVPQTLLHWKVGELEYRTAERAQYHFEKELQRRGLPIPTRLPLGDDWINRTAEKAHPTGTTRMSENAADGVVDVNCKVFGQNGIYVAGSSVFPTAGAANPTLMIVASSIRLADHLNSTLLKNRKASLSTRFVRKSGGLRVGFIGASKRVCEMHLSVVDYLGYEVVGFTSRSNSSAYRLESRSGASRFESQEQLARECELLIVAVSDDLSEEIVTSLANLNVPLLCETPIAWTIEGVQRIMSHEFSKIGVAEQFPFLPLEQVRRRVLPQLGRIKSVINDGAVYSYHGIAQLRQYLDGQPMYARGDTVKFNSGQTLTHREHSAQPSFRIVGTEGEIVDETLTVNNRTYSVERGADGTISLAGERWQNPYPGLTDEQVAVATVIEGMKGNPVYCPQQFGADIEIVQALRYSKTGAKIKFPLHARTAKLRSTLFSLTKSQTS